MTFTSYVYFIAPRGEDGPVKIGFSVYPKSRLLTYMAWSPIPLEIRATLPVAVELPQRRGPALYVERQLHQRYRAWRLHHEWFEASPLLLADIEEIIVGTFDTTALPPPFQAAQQDAATPDTPAERAA